MTETNAERLEQVKMDFKFRNNFEELVTNEECKVSLNNYDYLIEQAERVQELEELAEHRLKMLKYCSDARRKYFGVIKKLYNFDGDVQGHSALADMLCGEIIEEVEVSNQNDG